MDGMDKVVPESESIGLNLELEMARDWLLLIDRFSTLGIPLTPRSPESIESTTLAFGFSGTIENPSTSSLKQLSSILTSLGTGSISFPSLTSSSL